MLRSRRLAACLAVALLSFPAAALAGSAGDNQYQDPFANAPPQTQPKKKTPQQVPGNSQASSPSTSAPAQSFAQAAPAASSTRTAPASGQQLPRTGVDVRLLAAVGVGLLAVGLAVRRLT